MLMGEPILSTPKLKVSRTTHGVLACRGKLANSCLLRLHCGELADTGGVAGAELLSLHHPLPSIPASGGKVDFSQPSLIDLVNHLHQRLAARIPLPVSEEVSLVHAGRGEIGQHDAPLHIADIISPDPAQQRLNQSQQVAGI